MVMKDAKQIIKEFTDEVWNRNKSEVISKYISKSYVAHTLGKGGTVRGISGVKNNVLACHSKYSGLNITIKKMVQDKDFVSSWIVLRSGNKVMNEFIMHKVKGNKIVEAWSIGGDWLSEQK